MNYSCQTPNCAIALSKATFPVAMNCPVCQQSLVEEKKESEISIGDEVLINSLPYVIAYPLKQTLLEKHAWSKINLFKDTFQNYLKYLGLLSASEFFNSELKDKKMVALFQQTLAEPSFGTWNLFIRECLKYLNENKHTYFCKELPNYYETIESGKKRKLYSGEIEYIDGNGDVQLKKQEATAIGMLINFRNRYLGHGLTLDSETSQKLWDEYFPLFKTLLQQLSFAKDYPMLKRDGNETHLLHSAEINTIESLANTNAKIWVQNKEGKVLKVVPFFIVPGEVAISNTDKAKMLSYESYTGKTIKFFSPEGIEKQTSGKILERLNLLLREKQKETPFTPKAFTKDQFLNRIAEENKLLLDTLIAEKKIIPGVYQHREEIEIKLREWIGARANIFFIAAEAGSGKTNLLAEIQKQYTERQLPSLLIRAGRMEKQTLKQQIAYLLNIDLEQGLQNYISIAGTQAQPTFILIDGLNEANNAEEIWQETIELSKLFEPGSLKFVITNRANSETDLDRYTITQTEQAFLYGENKDNKDNKNGLSAFVFWLTALNMKEMQSAWESYITKDKSRFKPLFSFNDLATFDRGLYQQINNPLILRLFLEIYQGKTLPKKGAKYLNIWQDWLTTFSSEEQTFLKLMANAVWEKGENELLLDDLLKNETLKPYFTSDIINTPYKRLKNNGWISRYVKDLNSYIGFTVEGALLYLLAIQLQEQKPLLNLSSIQLILFSGNKLQKSAIESFLCEKALNGDLILVAEIIDTGNEDIDLCIKPLLLYLKTYGVQATIEKILENPTENDWNVLLNLEIQLDELQLHVLRKEFLIALMPKNEFKSKEAIKLGLSAISIFDQDEALFYLNIIDTCASSISEDADLLSQLGIIKVKFGEYNKALEYYEMSLAFRLKVLGEEHPAVATSYHLIGVTWAHKFEYKKALKYFEKSLVIRLKIYTEEHRSIAISYSNIGSAWGCLGETDIALKYFKKGLHFTLKTFGEDHLNSAYLYHNIGNAWDDKNEYDKALEYYEKSMATRLQILGSEHLLIADSYCNIASSWKSKREYDKAIEYCEKCLAIQLNTLGREHLDVAKVYNLIGEISQLKVEYNKALEYHEKCLTIRLKSLGDNHSDVALSYNNIGLAWKSKENYKKAVIHYEKAFKILKKGGIAFQIAQCYEKLNDKKNALAYYIQSAEIRKEDPTVGLEAEATKESILNAKRLAKELNKENELPECIKDSKL